MSFGSDLRKLCDKAQGRLDLVVRKTALELQTSIVMMSPVDTGRFRGNWQMGFNAINADTNSAEDKSGGAAIARTAAALSKWKPGDTIFLTNSLPYARRLEYGWSKQAPQGMVRLTVLGYGQALSKVVRGG